jgi:7,8-dihydroneopterin aldolase/epimerase/oxygenase
MLTIHLQQLQFFAYHGLYPNEKAYGNQFELNIDVDIDAAKNINKLSETVDYAELYGIIKKRMQQPTPLLETVAQELADLLLQYSALIKKVSISIQKKSPPIADFTGNVAITFTKGK